MRYSPLADQLMAASKSSDRCVVFIVSHDNLRSIRENKLKISDFARVSLALWLSEVPRAARLKCLGKKIVGKQCTMRVKPIERKWLASDEWPYESLGYGLAIDWTMETYPDLVIKMRPDLWDLERKGHVKIDLVKSQPRDSETV